MSTLAALPFALTVFVAAETAPEGGAGLLSRPEPSLKAGAEALEEGRFDDALQAFRRAKAERDDERAVVEYDVGQALLQRALAEAAAREEGAEPDPAIEPALREAQEAFERAYGLAKSKRLRSEAAHASGNALAEVGELDKAVEAYRRALVADPQNERARKNLAAALRALRAQPPLPPESQSGQSEEQKDRGDEQKEQEQKDRSDEQKEQEQKAPKEQAGQGEREQKPKQPKGQSPADPQRGDEKTPPGEPKPKPEPDPRGESLEDEPDAPAPRPADQKGEKKEAPAPARPEDKDKEDARRLLDALRSRERPLAPQLLRKLPKAPPPEKDW